MAARREGRPRSGPHSLGSNSDLLDQFEGELALYKELGLLAFLGLRSAEVARGDGLPVKLPEVAKL